jgi:hypothetical protein
MGRIAAALAATVLLLAACGDDDDAATPETTAVDPVEDLTDETTTTEAEGTTTTTEADGEIPDLAGAEVLAEAGMLRNGEARVGATAPDDPAIQAALCEYVFGGLDEIGSLTGLPGEIELYDDSGFDSQPGEGYGLLCLYVADGVEALAVALWSEEIPTDDADDGVNIVLNGPVGNDHHGVVAYGPDYDGPQMDEITADAWMADAATRWGGASV